MDGRTHVHEMERGGRNILFYGQKGGGGRTEIYEIASLCFKEKKMRGEEKALTS